MNAHSRLMIIAVLVVIIFMAGLIFLSIRIIGTCDDYDTVRTGKTTTRVCDND